MTLSGRARPALVVLASVLAAAASMAIWPSALTYDAWAWLVWGRELGDGALDTTGGPSWKPFPVLITTPLALLGDAAPVLWQLFVRTGGVLTLAATASLAHRCTPRTHGRTDGARHRLCRSLGDLCRLVFAWSAAVLAVVFVVAGPGPDPRWFRLVTEAHTAVLAGGCVVWALDRHLAGRPATAYGFLVAAGLMRPEGWPLLLAYAAWWTWTSRRSGRDSWTTVAAVASAGLVAQPVLWFGGDLLGSGSVAHGAAAAQVGDATFGGRLVDVAEMTAELLPPIGWALVAANTLCLARGVRTRSANSRCLAQGVRVAGVALAWWATAAVLAVAGGYAALSRFVLPTAMLLAVLAAVGAVTAVSWLAGSGPAPAGIRVRSAVGVVGVVAVVVAGMASVDRVGELRGVVDEVVARGERAEDLDALVDDLTADGPLAPVCPVVSLADGPLSPQLAWALDRPLRDVYYGALPFAGPGLRIMRAPLPALDPATAPDPAIPVEVARSRYWVVSRADC